jgi:N-acetylmuramoyl-L-alanine amidase
MRGVGSATALVSLAAAVFMAIPGLFAQSTGTAQPNGTQTAVDAGAVRAALDRALTVAPYTLDRFQPPLQAGVLVRDVEVRRAGTRQDIVIDLSQKTLTYDPSGDIERLLDHLIAGTAPLTAGARDVRYEFLIDGLPLEQFLPRVVSPARVGPRAIAHGGRVLVSAGHGWYWDEASNRWLLQRDYYWGIVEDLVNWEIATYLWHELRRLEMDARPARLPEATSEPGPSGNPMWQESAKYFFQSLGAPPSVWDLGANDYNKDINSRPLYANWIDAAAVVSIHNNGGGGTGTETWFDETNGQQAESRRLAQIMNDHIVGAIRAHYDRNWPDRGVRSCNGCHGENRLAARPAVIVEIAFMDTKAPDNAALHDDRFKRIVAGAMMHALLDWGR